MEGYRLNTERYSLVTHPYSTDYSGVSVNIAILLYTIAYSSVFVDTMNSWQIQLNRSRDDSSFQPVHQPTEELLTVPTKGESEFLQVHKKEKGKKEDKNSRFDREAGGTLRLQGKGRARADRDRMLGCGESERAARLQKITTQALSCLSFGKTTKASRMSADC